MKTPTHMFKHTATLRVPVNTRADSMDVQLTYTDSTIQCTVQDSGGSNTLMNERLTGQRFSRGMFKPGCAATKDSLLTITAGPLGTAVGKKYKFASPLKDSGGEGICLVASLEGIE